MEPADLSENFTEPHSMLVIRGNSDSTYNSETSSREQFSTFSDGACGEPFTAQHLLLDFTPLEDEDNEFLQKKCCAFWEFVNSRTDIHKLMVIPDTCDLKSQEETRLKDQHIEKIAKEQLVEESTAVTMLRFAEGKGVLDHAFETKLPMSKCSLKSREYDENMSNFEKIKEELKKRACHCKGMCISCKNWQPGSTFPEPDSSPVVQQLERQMREWDRTHIKCMDPPGHSPELSHCILQRNPTK